MILKQALLLALMMSGTSAFAKNGEGALGTQVRKDYVNLRSALVHLSTNIQVKKEIVGEQAGGSVGASVSSGTVLGGAMGLGAAGSESFSASSFHGVQFQIVPGEVFSLNLLYNSQHLNKLLNDFQDQSKSGAPFIGASNYYNQLVEISKLQSVENYNDVIGAKINDLRTDLNAAITQGSQQFNASDWDAIQKISMWLESAKISISKYAPLDNAEVRYLDVGYRNFFGEKWSEKSVQRRTVIQFPLSGLIAVACEFGADPYHEAGASDSETSAQKSDYRLPENYRCREMKVTAELKVIALETNPALN